MALYKMNIHWKNNKDGILHRAYIRTKVNGGNDLEGQKYSDTLLIFTLAKV